MVWKILFQKYIFNNFRQNYISLNKTHGTSTLPSRYRYNKSQGITQIAPWINYLFSTALFFLFTTTIASRINIIPASFPADNSSL